MKYDLELEYLLLLIYLTYCMTLPLFRHKTFFMVVLINHKSKMSNQIFENLAVNIYSTRP